MVKGLNHQFLVFVIEYIPSAQALVQTIVLLLHCMLMNTLDVLLVVALSSHEVLEVLNESVPFKNHLCDWSCLVLLLFIHVSVCVLSPLSEASMHELRVNLPINRPETLDSKFVVEYLVSEPAKVNPSNFLLPLVQQRSYVKRCSSLKSVSC